jgi:hypothetical protein
MFNAPKDIYGPNLFKIFADELGGPARVAKLLHTTEQTVKRWMLCSTKVPRAAVLALYWETQYGRSAMFADQVNEIRLLYRHIDILQRQYTRAKDIVTGLRRIQSDTANEPYFDELKDAGFFMPNKYGTSAPVLPTISPENPPRREAGLLVARA